MSGPGRGRKQISYQTSSEKKDYLIARASALGWSESRVGEAILDYWLGMGAPPLSAPEAAMGVAPIPEDITSQVSSFFSQHHDERQHAAIGRHVGQALAEKAGEARRLAKSAQPAGAPQSTAPR